MPFEKTTIQILFIIESILLQSDPGHRLAANGPAIKRTERKILTRYVGIARGQPCEIVQSFHFSPISQGQVAGRACSRFFPKKPDGAIFVFR
jgi:hypothetical protein